MRQSTSLSVAAAATILLGTAMRPMAAQEGNVVINGDSPSPAAAARRAPTAAPVALSVKAAKRVFAPGDAVTLTITVKVGAKDRPAVLQFATAQKYDMAIYRGAKPDAKELWRWARDRMFAMVLTSVTVSPEKPATFVVTFDAAKEKMPALSPGVYSVIATLTTMGAAPHPHAIATFTVKK